MSKFNAGDRVRVVQECWRGPAVGTEVVISHIDKYDSAVPEGYVDSWRDDRFELVSVGGTKLKENLTAILVDIDCLVLSVAYGDTGMTLLEKIKGISKAVRELRDVS